MRAGPKFEILATNRLDEICMATPAISEGMLIIRAKDHVYGIGTPKVCFGQSTHPKRATLQER